LQPPKPKAFFSRYSWGAEMALSALAYYLFSRLKVIPRLFESLMNMLNTFPILNNSPLLRRFRCQIRHLQFRSYWRRISI
jgi:hypothetical protein